MTAAEYEQAIHELEKLIESNAPESSFQSLLEQQPQILRSLGYELWIPHPNLPLPEGQKYIPDFICRRPSGAWEVIDLKTPKVRILRGKKRREAFTAEMNSYIGQMHDYSEWFNDAKNRELFESRYGHSMHSRPDAVIIAGRNSELDKHELFRQVKMISGVAVITYDDVVQSLVLEHARHYLAKQYPIGTTIITVARIFRGRSGINRTVWEVGQSGLTSLKLFVDEFDRLSLSVTIGGQEQRISVPSTDNVFMFDRPEIFYVEFGISLDGEYLLQLRVDGRVVAAATVPLPDALLINWQEITLGTDHGKTEFASFAVARFARLDGIPPFRDRLDIHAEMRETYGL